MIQEIVESEVAAFRAMCEAEGLPVSVVLWPHADDRPIVIHVRSPASVDGFGIPVDYPNPSEVVPWMRARFRESLSALASAAK